MLDPRNLPDPLEMERPPVNVRDHGATGDLTDDTAAVQAAIDATPDPDPQPDVHTDDGDG